MEVSFTKLKKKENTFIIKLLYNLEEFCIKVVIKSPMSNKKLTNCKFIIKNLFFIIICNKFLKITMYDILTIFFLYYLLILALFLKPKVTFLHSAFDRIFMNNFIHMFQKIKSIKSLNFNFGFMKLFTSYSIFSFISYFVYFFKYTFIMLNAFIIFDIFLLSFTI